MGVIKVFFMKNLRHVFLWYLIAAFICVMSIDLNKAYLKRIQYMIYWGQYAVFAQPTGDVNKENFRRAIIYYKFISKVLPKFSRSYAMIGYSYYRIGEYAKSIQFYQEAIKRDSNTFWFYYNLGIIHFKLGEYEPAVRYFQETVKQDIAGMTQAAVLGPLKKYSPQHRLEFYKIAQAFARTVRLNAQRLIILSFERLKDYRNIQDRVQQGLREDLDGNKDFLYYYGGFAAYQQEMYSRAALFFNQCLKINPQHPHAYYYLGETLKKTAPTHPFLSSAPYQKFLTQYENVMPGVDPYPVFHPWYKKIDVGKELFL